MNILQQKTATAKQQKSNGTGTREQRKSRGRRMDRRWKTDRMRKKTTTKAAMDLVVQYLANFRVDLDTEQLQFRRLQWINHQMHIVKLASDGACAVGSLMITPNDVYAIIANLPFFMNLLLVFLLERHQSGHVEDGFVQGSSVIDGVLTGGELLRVQPACKTSVSTQLDPLSQHGDKLFILSGTSSIAQDAALVFLSRRHVQHAYFIAFAGQGSVQQPQLPL